LGLVVAAAARELKTAGVATATAVAAAEFLIKVRRDTFDDSMSILTSEINVATVVDGRCWPFDRRFIMP
jgi:hypothetical protein